MTDDSMLCLRHLRDKTDQTLWGDVALKHGGKVYLNLCQLVVDANRSLWG